MMGRLNKRAQVWSIDLFIAVVIFLLALGVFYFFMSRDTAETQSKLKIESQLIATKLVGEEQGSIINGTTLDDQKLESVLNMEYDQLKQELNIKDDFCVVFKDQEGRVLLIGEENLTGIGNNDAESLILTLDGENFTCGERYTG